MRRRTFLAGTVAGLVSVSCNQTPSRLRAGDIPRRVFGKTGERLTIVGQAGGASR